MAEKPPGTPIPTAAPQPDYCDGPLIRGSQVDLRPTTQADLPFLQSLWNDGQAMQHVGYPAGLGMTPAKMAAWWEGCQSWSATHLIVETQAGTPIGETGWGFDGTPGMLEMKLAPACWGQGYAGDALRALLAYLQGQTTVEEMIVTPHRNNVAARRLYQNLGFRPAVPPAALAGGAWDYWTLSRGGTPLARPDVLVFDWGGVLMRTADAGGRRAWEGRLGLAPGEADRAVFESQPWREAQLGRLGVDQCWRAIGDRLGLAGADLAAFRHDFWAGDRLDEELVQRLQEWKAAGYRMALLSNFTLELADLLRDCRLDRLFDPVVISAREGVAKPASRLFWRLLNRMGISPAQAVLIDDFAENVAGARDVGLYAVQFHNAEMAIRDLEALLP